MELAQSIYDMLHAAETSAIPLDCLAASINEKLPQNKSVTVEDLNRLKDRAVPPPGPLQELIQREGYQQLLHSAAKRARAREILKPLSQQFGSSSVLQVLAQHGVHLQPELLERITVDQDVLPEAVAHYILANAEILRQEVAEASAHQREAQRVDEFRRTLANILQYLHTEAERLVLARALLGQNASREQVSHLAEKLPRIAAGQELDHQVMTTVLEEGHRYLRKVRLFRAIQDLISAPKSATDIANAANVDNATVTHFNQSLSGSTETIAKLERACASLYREMARKGKQSTWSASREQLHPEEKAAVGAHWAEYHFLKDLPGPTGNYATTAATVLVSHGTTQTEVVDQVLRWIELQLADTYYITWYPAGTRVADRIRQFQLENPHLRTAAQLFLLPGLVDLERERIFGPEVQAFLENWQRIFTYIWLGAYAFDLTNGIAYFQFEDEVPLQRLLAGRPAIEKVLFLDWSKLRCEGAPGFGVAELLEDAKGVTICVGVQSAPARLRAEVRKQFGELVHQVARALHSPPEPKRLRLCLVCSVEQGEVLSATVEGHGRFHWNHSAQPGSHKWDDITPHRGGRATKSTRS